MKKKSVLSVTLSLLFGLAFFMFSSNNSADASGWKGNSTLNRQTFECECDPHGTCVNCGCPDCGSYPEL